MFTYIYNAVHYCTDFGTNTLVRVSCVRKEMVSLFLATVPKEKEHVQFWANFGVSTRGTPLKTSWPKKLGHSWTSRKLLQTSFGFRQPNTSQGNLIPSWSCRPYIAKNPKKTFGNGSKVSTQEWMVSEFMMFKKSDPHIMASLGPSFDNRSGRHSPPRM